MDCSKCTD